MPLELPVTTATFSSAMVHHRIPQIAAQGLNNAFCPCYIASALRLREDIRFAYSFMKRTDSMPTPQKQHTSGPGEIAPAKGKLGVMIPGMGAVATTFVAGVEAVRKGISSP